jgi:hypothetical protein
MKFTHHAVSPWHACVQVWDPDAPADTSAQHNRHQHKVSPYVGMQLKGRVLATFVGGAQVYDEKKGVFSGSCGGVLKRKWLDVPREKKGGPGAPATAA